MGQYHLLVNLNKKQVVHPHHIGNGLKLREQTGWEYSTSTVLVMLLAACSGRGGGDFRAGNKSIGSWAGDRIAFVGDYAEPEDIHGVNAQEIYEKACAACHPEDTEGFAQSDGWKDISLEVRQMMADEFGISYEGDGWLEIKEPEKAGAH